MCVNFYPHILNKLIDTGFVMLAHVPVAEGICHMGEALSRCM